MTRPFSSRMRFYLAALVGLLAAGNAWLAFDRDERTEPPELIVDMSTHMIFDPSPSDTLARLGRDGSWHLEGRKVPNLMRVWKRGTIRPVIDLRGNETYGNAIHALTRVASEGGCNPVEIRVPAEHRLGLEESNFLLSLRTYRIGGKQSLCEEIPR